MWNKGRRNKILTSVAGIRDGKERMYIMYKGGTGLQPLVRASPA